MHSAEVSTLYPHHGTHGLVLPFGWTNDIPTKPIYCMTLSRPLQQTPLWAMSWVSPMSTRDILPPRGCHRHGQNKNCPKRGLWIHTTRAHKAMTAYLIRIARTHNLT